MRVQQPDCQIHGYVLDGFPKTLQQMQMIEELRVHPTLFVILECNDDLVYQRLANRKIDPISGSVYDENSAKVLDPMITSRLFPIPNEKPEVLARRYIRVSLTCANVLGCRLSRWKDLLKNVEDQYSHIILKVNAEMTEKNVLEKVAYYLENT